MYLPGSARGAFTLVEMLVVLFIMALLLALLIPALVAARQEAQAFVCMDNSRDTAVDFHIFADPYAHAYRGDSERLGTHFNMLDYVESRYETGEFETGSSQSQSGEHRYGHGRPPVTCPAGPSGLKRLTGAIAEVIKPYVRPLESVSYAFNRRLFRAPVMRSGHPSEVPVVLDDRIMGESRMPLWFDVDAGAAVAAGPPETTRLPFFSAPKFRNFDYWYPAMRHRGRINISFLGGQVISTEDPFEDPSWDWSYHPSVDSP